MANSGQNIFAGTLIHGLYYSTNNGVKWNTCFGLAPGCTVNSLAVNGSKMYAGTDHGIYISIDGISWSGVSNGLPWNTNVSALAENGVNIYAGSNH